MAITVHVIAHLFRPNCTTKSVTFQFKAQGAPKMAETVAVQ